MRSVLLLALLLAACEAPDDSPQVAADSVASPPVAESSALKACDLVTEAELEEILGVELDSARTTNDYAGVSQCRWDLPGDAQRGVSISFYEQGNLENYSRVPGSEAVAGIGDAAIWNASVGQLAVREGERLVSIGLLIALPQRAQAERVAALALAKL